MGVEPTSSAWKADVLAVVRQPHHTYDIIPACVGICQVVLQLDQLIFQIFQLFLQGVAGLAVVLVVLHLLHHAVVL